MTDATTQAEGADETASTVTLFSPKAFNLLLKDNKTTISIVKGANENFPASELDHWYLGVNGCKKVVNGVVVALDAEAEAVEAATPAATTPAKQPKPTKAEAAAAKAEAEAAAAAKAAAELAATGSTDPANVQAALNHEVPQAADAAKPAGGTDAAPWAKKE